MSAYVALLMAIYSKTEYIIFGDNEDMQHLAEASIKQEFCYLV